MVRPQAQCGLDGTPLYLGRLVLYAQAHSLPRWTCGVEPFPYLLIADGCSSSKFSDFGARLLVVTAKKLLQKQVNAEQFPNAKKMGIKIARKAKILLKRMALPDYALDATLIIAFVWKHYVCVYCYGDGAVVYRDKCGELKWNCIEYTHNAPYYLSYQNSKNKEINYRKNSGQAEKLLYSNQGIKRETITEPSVFKFPISSLSSLSVMSDGLSSFVDSKRCQIVAPESIVGELMDFKNTKQYFVKRRLKRFLKN